MSDKSQQWQGPLPEEWQALEESEAKKCLPKGATKAFYRYLNDPSPRKLDAETLNDFAVLVTNAPEAPYKQIETLLLNKYITLPDSETNLLKKGSREKGAPKEKQHFIPRDNIGSQVTMLLAQLTIPLRVNFSQKLSRQSPTPLSPDEVDALDLMDQEAQQTAIMKVLRFGRTHTGTPEAIKSMSATLGTAIMNEMRYQRRDRRTRHIATVELSNDAGDSVTEVILNALPDNTTRANPELTLGERRKRQEAKDLLSAIRKEIAGMKPKQQTIILDWCRSVSNDEDTTIAALADKHGLPFAAVKADVWRFRNKMKESLGGTWVNTAFHETRPGRNGKNGNGARTPHASRPKPPGSESVGSSFTDRFATDGSQTANEAITR